MPQGDPAGYLPSVKKARRMGGVKPYKTRKLRKKATGLRPGTLPKRGRFGPPKIRVAPPNQGPAKPMPRPRVPLDPRMRKVQKGARKGRYGMRPVSESNLAARQNALKGALKKISRRR